MSTNLGIQVNKDLIGNLIILLANKCKPLYHTKLMKLLFFIDEEATKTKGTPITWLDYKAWRFGSVSPELFYSKNEGQNKFNKFVEFEITNAHNTCIVKPVKEFDDSEFSEWDLEIIDSVLQKYGKTSTKNLIKLNHTKNSLWHRTVKRTNTKFTCKNQTSDQSLNFLELIDNDDYKKSVYYSTLENLELKFALQNNR